MGLLYRRFCAVQAAWAMSFLVAMVGLIFLGGVARMAGHPLNWTGDAATALFAWACFLCADIAWRRNSLMAIELVTSRLPPLAQRVLRLANHCVICGFLLYVAGYGAWLGWVSRARSFQGIPEISYSWVTMSFPVGALMLLVTTLLKMRDEFQGKETANVAMDVL
ncbi:MAG TPA: TRAP transporter small permease subunit [Ramlibacter sp.]|jgi:TRAP-type C4-dicarboxylate transport system permease small subunit